MRTVASGLISKAFLPIIHAAALDKTLLLLSFLFLFSHSAQAKGCYPPLAANVIAEMIRGGASAGQAMQEAINSGYVDSQACATRVVGYMRSYPYSFGDVIR